jgi:hypothetical protein
MKWLLVLTVHILVEVFFSTSCQNAVFLLTTLIINYIAFSGCQVDTHGHGTNIVT